MDLYAQIAIHRKIINFCMSEDQLVTKFLEELQDILDKVAVVDLNLPKAKR